ncbi:MAG TPA: peptidoglycan DD-metalloendopeptidase family protein [Gallionella sp.]
MKTFLTLLILSVLLAGCAGGKNRAPVFDGSKGDPDQGSTANTDWRPEFHVVQKGDTMYSIAFNYGYDYHELAEMNGIKDPTLISIGQQIRLHPRGQEAEAIAAPAAVELRQVDNLLKDQPKLVKYSYSEKALAQIEQVQSAPSAIVTTLAAADKADIPRAAKPAPVKQPVVQPVVSAAPAAATVKEADLDWGMPAQGRVIARFSEAANRKGIDIAGKLGQPVLASASGKVVYSGNGLRGYGKLIIIKHNSTFLSAYAHNDQIHVKEGQSVTKGQKIAAMGSTDAEQVKLHFEVRRLGKPVDPAKYLPLGNS